MPKINRESIEDAQMITELFLPDYTIRKTLLTFLSNAIIFSNGLKTDNWNLNLDKNGRFIRLNVGQEYCITIFKKYSSILVLRALLRDSLKDNELRITFKGYDGKNRILTGNLLTVPDRLAKVPGSVACQVLHEDIISILPYLEEANRCFISYAINNTVQLPPMNKAHSTGFISYLSKFDSKQIPNPVYVASESNFYEKQDEEEREARSLSISEIMTKIKDSHKRPLCINVSTAKFNRSSYVAEYAKRIANGICQDCNEPAPFINKLTDQPFLEIHHIIPLAKGGSDAPENTIAICPNCHRKRHYG
jgi:hypothetical protein